MEDSAHRPAHRELCHAARRRCIGPDLQGIAGLLYEIWMLFEIYGLLEGGVQNTVVRNALIASFCIHARALIEFFNDKKGRSVGVRRQHVCAVFRRSDLGHSGDEVE
jgi:hypothetical protein